MSVIITTVRSNACDCGILAPRFLGIQEIAGVSIPLTPGADESEVELG